MQIERSSFYTEEELARLGFRSYGNNVKISRLARFYGTENISIGDNVRIDDFCILSGRIAVGSHIHISAYVALYGSMGIVLEDYTGISPRSTIYSAMDDFSGEHLIGPIHDSSKTSVSGGKVVISRFCQIGSNTVVFPNLTVGEGTVVGACSLVNKSLDPLGVYYGITVVRRKERCKKVLGLI